MKRYTILKDNRIYFIVNSFVLFLLLLQISWANTTYSPTELITISKETSLPAALTALEAKSQQFENRKILNLSSYKGPIEIPINQVYWKEALSTITKFHELDMEVKPGVYIIKDYIPPEIEVEEEEITPDTKQVKISAIFFKADKSALNSLGIDWSTFSNGDVVISAEFKGASRVADDILSISGSTTVESGNITVDVNALLRVLEANQVGTIMARPNITVMSGKKGYVQVGEDFSVKTLDEAGNITEEFFSAGIILEVTPTVVKKGDTEAIHLVTRVERSSATPGEISTIIAKSQSTTEVVLFDGEETVIAGLYNTEDKVMRSGIPFLKDLPWWVFGIRYLSGYDRVEKVTSEMIIILKAEIVEPIEVRKERGISTQEKIRKMREDRGYIDTLFNEETKPPNEEAKDKDRK
ncbi:MAG: type II secretion system protein GspD [Candidatus Cloacimonadia bacterium]